MEQELIILAMEVNIKANGLMIIRMELEYLFM